MAVAMTRQQPGHIEILQRLQRADLLFKIPPAVLLGAHQHLLLSVPPEVITAEQQVLVCSKQYCWWNFEEQIRSLEKLQHLDVAWLLPGHGHRHHFATGQWQQAVQQTLAWIQR